MELTFVAKEENNHRQEEEFQALSYVEDWNGFSRCWMKSNSWEKTNPIRMKRRKFYFKAG